MGGTAANRVTAGISGIAGITLGATGGSEAVHQHSHTNTASFTGSAVTSGAGSAHTHTQNAHTHTQNAHSHTIYGSLVPRGTGNVFRELTSSANSVDRSDVASESVTATNQNTTATNQNESAHTHSVTAAGTVTITNANFGTGSSQNMQPSIILNYIIKY
jgi:hypothetical protein